jgi:hypothetical protein
MCVPLAILINGIHLWWSWQRSIESPISEEFDFEKTTKPVEDRVKFSTIEPFDYTAFDKEADKTSAGNVAVTLPPSKEKVFNIPAKQTANYPPAEGEGISDLVEYNKYNWPPGATGYVYSKNKGYIWVYRNSPLIAWQLNTQVSGVNKQTLLQVLDKAWDEEYKMINRWWSVEENQATTLPEPALRQYYNEQAQQNFNRRDEELKAKYKKMMEDAKKIPSQIEADYLAKFWQLHNQEMEAKESLWQQNRQKELKQIWAFYEQQQREKRLTQQIDQLRFQIQTEQQQLQRQLRDLEWTLSDVRRDLQWHNLWDDDWP